MSTSKTAKAAMGDKGVSGKRFLNGKEVRPVMYMGRIHGHGKYVAGMIDNQMILDASGKPVRYRSIGLATV